MSQSSAFILVLSSVTNRQMFGNIMSHYSAVHMRTAFKTLNSQTSINTKHRNSAVKSLSCRVAVRSGIWSYIITYFSHKHCITCLHSGMTPNQLQIFYFAMLSLLPLALKMKHVWVNYMACCCYACFILFILYFQSPIFDLLLFAA